jgi:hypothetical protein
MRPLDPPASQSAHVRFTSGQYADLLAESVRTGLSIAELVRRAVDVSYRENRRPLVGGFQLNFALRRGADSADVARLTRWPRRVRD